MNYGLNGGNEAKAFTRFVRDSGNLYFACEILWIRRILRESAGLWNRWWI